MTGAPVTVESIPLDTIQIPDGHRAIDNNGVANLAASMLQIGLKTPVTVRRRDGVTILVTGGHRLAAAKLNGWSHIDAFVQRDDDDRAARLWTISENLHRAELSVLERAEQVSEYVRLVEEGRVSSQVGPKSHGRPEGGQRAAARELGLAKSDVHRATKIDSLTPEAKQAAKDSGLDDHQSVLLTVAAAPAAEQAETVEAIAAKRVRGTLGTGESEWFTPGQYLVLARDVLGSIDLDPASCDQAQENVQASQYFTVESDGLAQPWHGRVWLNPPYSQPAITHFVTKLIAEWRAGHVTAAIMLTHNYSDSSWFHEAAAAASAMCFTRGRIRFVDASGNLAAPTQGQTFFYFGPDAESFAETFCEIGLVLAAFQGTGLAPTADDDGIPAFLTRRAGNVAASETGVST